MEIIERAENYFIKRWREGKGIDGEGCQVITDLIAALKEEQAENAKMREALGEIAEIDQDYDAKLVGHYLLKKKCKIIAKSALGGSK